MVAFGEKVDMEKAIAMLDEVKADLGIVVQILVC